MWLNLVGEGGRETSGLGSFRWRNGDFFDWGVVYLRILLYLQIETANGDGGSVMYAEK